MASSAPVDLYGRFAAAGARAPERPALLASGATGPTRVDFGELFARAHGLSAALAALGVERGDRVALHLGTRPEFVDGYLAILRLGAALLPIHVDYRPREVAYLLADAEPRLVVTGEAGLETVRCALDALPRPHPEIVSIDELERRAAAAPAPANPFEPLAEPVAGDLAILLYTSGTTGKSKGAMLSHGNVGAMIDSLHEAWQWTSRDVLYLALPLFHLHGLVVGLSCALAAGASVRLEARFDAAVAVDALGRGESTLFFGVPTLYRRLVEELGRRGAHQRFSGVRLFVSGSAPLPPETFEAFRTATGRDILERYGMTETGMLASNPLHGERRAGSVGLPLPGVELRIASPGGDALPPGREGEVEVQGGNVFAGYWRAPEKSAESFRVDAQGRRWFRTGDLGRIDPADGYLTLLGRRSELILSGGFNVYPREIEEVLTEHPAVAEAAVVAEPHADFGQSPVAFVVLTGALAPGELEAHCRERLAPFKLPRRFLVLDALPRNALGKIEKRRLLSTLGPSS